MSQKASFTLVELLIVIGILAILTASIVLIINPAQRLKEARDSTRIQELSALEHTISILLTQQDRLFIGTSTYVYISIPDSSSTCGNLGLPALPAGFTYQCAGTSTLRHTDGTGWIPIDFTNSSITQLPTLPLDPTNTTSSGLYYTYMMGGSFELSTSVESEKYKQVAQSDGGPSDHMIEKGTDKNLLPPTANLRFLPVSDAIAYWDAESGITYAGSNLVSEWKDQGGTYTMTQATSSLQPQVKISPNKPITVVSDVSSDETVGISPAINVSEYTYFVVGRPEYNSDCLAMTTVAANTQYAFRFSYNGSGSSPRLRSGDIDIYTVDDLNMAVYSAKRTSGGTTTAFRNSIQKYSGTAPTVFDPNAIAFRYGELAVFIVYDRALTDTEMDTMETYLNGKYNIY